MIELHWWTSVQCVLWFISGHHPSAHAQLLEPNIGPSHTPPAPNQHQARLIKEGSSGAHLGFIFRAGGRTAGGGIELYDSCHRQMRAADTDEFVRKISSQHGAMRRLLMCEFMALHF